MPMQERSSLASAVSFWASLSLQKPYVKATREKYNSAREGYCSDPAKVFGNSGMVKLNEVEKRNGAKRRLFYAPLELE